jgi:diamine N-acetyltransferase
MQISTRRATLADAETLSEISKSTFYDTFTGTCTEEDMQWFLTENFNLKIVQEELSNDQDKFYLALVNGKAVGYLRFMEDYSNFPHIQKWKSLELKRIYVEKDYHGKGIAQVLLNLVIEYAKENKYEVLYLGVWEHNTKAQKFYLKSGFVDSGYTHGFPIGDTPQTDNWLWKFL